MATSFERLGNRRKEVGRRGGYTKKKKKSRANISEKYIIISEQSIKIYYF
jgi:hypothetical protein